MHPYRARFVLDPGPELAARDGGARLAFAVLALAGGVQVAIAAPFSAAMWFGAACVVAGLAWLVRYRRD